MVVRSAWIDLEDAFVFQTALKVKADAIVTRNEDGFTQSSIRTFNCADLFDFLEQENGLTYAKIGWDD